MKTQIVNVEGRDYTLLSYKNMWVFPVIGTYEYGLGSPIAFFLYCWDGDYLEPYCDVTVNLPDCRRSAGCQFVETNKNGEDILEWLEENGFGKRTRNVGQSGFCTYPEFNFYKGEKFIEYKQFNDQLQSE